MGTTDPWIVLNINVSYQPLNLNEFLNYLIRTEHDSNI